METILILANNHMGLYKFRKELIEELLKRYIVYISLPAGEFVLLLEEMGCRFIETEIARRGMNPWQDLKLLRHYYRIMREIKPDVVLSYTIKPNVYGGMVCQLLNIPYLPNITGFGTAVENKGMLQVLTITLYKIGLRKSHKIYFQNESNLIFANKHNINHGTYELIPGSGVNLDYYYPRQYPDERKGLHFIYISRIMIEKGIDHYIEAAQIVKKKYPHTFFHVIGYCEDNYEERLQTLHQEGTIIYHGEQADVRPFHAKSHCIIHPTYYPEGISNVLLEAAASARPIITTNRFGTKEIVDEGINGFLVEARNTAALVEAIEQFIILPLQMKRLMGLASRKLVERHFDRQIIINTYLKEIEQIIADKQKE